MVLWRSQIHACGSWRNEIIVERCFFARWRGNFGMWWSEKCIKQMCLIRFSSFIRKFIFEPRQKNLQWSYISNFLGCLSSKREEFLMNMICTRKILKNGLWYNHAWYIMISDIERKGSTLTDLRMRLGRSRILQSRFKQPLWSLEIELQFCPSHFSQKRVK